MSEENIPELTLYDPSAGDLSLAFIDTVNWRGRDEPEENLNRCADLFTWAHEAGLIDALQAGNFNAQTQADLELAQTILAETVQIREALYRIFKAWIDGPPPLPGDMERFNRDLRAALAQREIQAEGASPHWVWRQTASPLAAVLRPVLLAAAELIVSEERARIRACGNEECGWLFIDRSRNRSRKWCSSESCGNRIRVRQFYSRSRESGH